MSFCQSCGAAFADGTTFLPQVFRETPGSHREATLSHNGCIGPSTPLS